MAEIAREVWRDRALAERLEREAEELKRRFDEAFWCEDRGGFYALALDGDKNQVDSICSNIGHLLWSQIVPPERVDAIVDQLMGEGLWSGWGVRTMSDAEPAYSPLSYHNGTVWPHDNSLIAWGLAHTPLARAHRIVQRMLAASRHFDHQLPEVFAGLRRSRHAVSDRLPDRGAAAGMGGGHAGPAPAAASGPAAGPAAAPPRVGRAARAAALGREDPPLAACAPSTRIWDVRVRTASGKSRGDMKIAVIAPCWFPVPPTGYGGIEWVVSLLADGLVDRGHDVTLFASGDSHTKAKLAAISPGCAERVDRTLVLGAPARPPLLRARRRLRRDQRPLGPGRRGARRGDRHARRAHRSRAARRRAGELYDQVARVAPKTAFISLSMNQRKPRPDYNWIANCPNALDLSVYPFRPQRGDYLLFLGRMSPDKGAHRAVAVAMEAGLPLKIAGKMREPKEQRVLREFVEPHLGDGHRVARRGLARREGRVAPARARDALSRSSGRSRSAW